MSAPTLISLNIAQPQRIAVDGNRGQVVSGIRKQPVREKTYLTATGFEGDGVGNKRVHGGHDKAVCVYCVDHYPHWEKLYGKPLAYGAFGENLSVTGLPETQVHIGDVFRIGEAKVQCTQPRQPCRTLSRFWDRPDLIQQVQSSGFSGYYLRVLEPGWVEPGTAVQLLESGPGAFSVQQANDLMHKNRSDAENLRRILAIEPLSASWKGTFSKRLEKVS